MQYTMILNWRANATRQEREGALLRQFTWQDVFEVSVYPSITPEDGLKLGPEAMGRAQAYLT